MSYLIAHGHAETKHAAPNDTWGETERSLGHIFLGDNGDIKVTVEGPDGDAAHDILITFPASAVEDAVRRRIRAGRPA